MLRLRYGSSGAIARFHRIPFGRTSNGALCTHFDLKIAQGGGLKIYQPGSFAIIL